MNERAGLWREGRAFVREAASGVRILLGTDATVFTMRTRTMHLILSALVALVLARRAGGDVTVNRQPVKVERRTFDPAHPPAEMPALKANEAAITESKFDCKVGMNYRVLAHKQTPGGCEATLQVQGIRLELGLTVIVWLPEHAPAKLVAHEEGHRRIAERIYAGAEQTAQAVAKPLDGKQVNGTGTDCDAAEKQATDAPADQACKGYLRETVGRATRVNDAYDDLTAHGTRATPSEDEAIYQAFQNVNAESRK